MEELLAYLRDFNLVSVFVRLLLSVLLGGLIGMERGRHGRAAGLRTHILVCLGASMSALIGVFLTKELGMSTDASRIAAQVISGIGFLGVGTIIIKGRFQVSGLTTAAGLWATAAIGLATGYAFYEGALIGTLLAVLTITVLSHLEAKVNHKNQRISLYIELDSVDAVRTCTGLLSERYEATDLQVTAPRSAVPNHVGVEATIRGRMVPEGEQELIRQLSEQPHVVFVLESI